VIAARRTVSAALAVARAALREGVERLPTPELAGVELDIRLLVDHRERLVPKSRLDITSATSDTAKASQAHRGRQPEHRASSPPVGTLPTAPDVADSRNQTASLTESIRRARTARGG